jgi:hypothetical protein
MYIPTTFMGSQGSCFNVTTSKLSGSGSISSGSFISGGFIWDYYQFENTLDPTSNSSSFEASINVLSGSTGQAKLFLVAGGGAGGYGVCVLSPSSCDMTAAGGGGGGGIVYYNNFPLASGSYNISVGAGGGNPSNPGRNGANTTFTYNIPYTPFTSNIITASGGGRGGYIINNGYGGTFTFVAGASGGSAGGTVVCSNGNGANQIIEACCDGLGGLNGANQGNDASGGIAGASNAQGTGGGGAGTPGAQTNGLAGPLVSVGGDGASYNLTGTTFTYAAGGGGVRGQGFPVVQAKANNGSGTAGFGNGGQGATLSFAQGTTATNGVVIIAIPICATDLYECREYRILGGATGGTITYVPCGTSTLVSASINTGYTGSVCTYKVGTTYPSATGTVTLTETGSCNSFIPLAATQSCASGTIQTAAFVYDFELPKACYPTPQNCQTYRVATSTINYVDYLGVSQSVTVGGGFGSNTGQICAREYPAPTILCNTIGGVSTPCTITKTSLVCGYYCSGSV